MATGVGTVGGWGARIIRVSKHKKEIDQLGFMLPWSLQLFLVTLPYLKSEIWSYCCFIILFYLIIKVSSLNSVCFSFQHWLLNHCCLFCSHVSVLFLLCFISFHFSSNVGWCLFSLLQCCVENSRTALCLKRIDQVIDITGAADKFPGCTVKSDKQCLMRGKY